MTEPTAPSNDRGGAAPTAGAGAGANGGAAAGRVGVGPGAEQGDDSANVPGDSSYSGENAHNGGQSAQTYGNGAGSAPARAEQSSRNDWTVQIP